MIRIKLSTLALAAVLVFPVAATACSKGSASPTEPAFDDEMLSASGSSLSTVAEESRGRGRGGNDDRNDDNDNNRRRGRGGRGDRDDDNRPGNNQPRNGREFEGAVASVGSNSVTLASGLRVVVDGGTQWVGRGDLFSLSQVSNSLSAGRNPRVEGRGTRQSDGSVLANTIKAEHVGD
ncbi:MAG TPA: hypothetical protein VN493_23705 [Thermoanaerobaculia bacterium]|nr:hypothetical protein [Thermoanaerobaculia bacterium]